MFNVKDSGFTGININIRPKKARLDRRNITMYIEWVCRGIIHPEFLKENETVNALLYVQ